MQDNQTNPQFLPDGGQPEVRKAQAEAQVKAKAEESQAQAQAEAQAKVKVEDGRMNPVFSQPHHSSSAVFSQPEPQPQPSSSYPQPQPYPQPDPDEINLLEYIYVLVKHKWWIIGATILGLVGGYVAALIKGPTYVAEAVIAAKESENQKTTSLAALSGMLASSLLCHGFR